MERFFYPSGTGSCDIAAYKWLPSGEPQAVIQIVHGMAEYALRYDDLANYLSGLGYAVYAEDHLGHGASINGKGKRGFFAETDGWTAVINDIMKLHETAKKENPGKKMILYGHSMGSFLARTCASRYPDEFDAFVFSGTAGKNPVLGIAKAIAKSHIKKHGADQPDDMLNKLAVGSYNKKIKDARTPVDWISCDNEVVDKYAADDLCGFTFTSGAFRDMFDGIGEITGKEWASKVKNVPIYLLAGRQDPVGNYGKGVIEVSDNLLKTGHTKVVLQLYENGRHEMHNELNKDEVYRGIAAFIKNV